MNFLRRINPSPLRVMLSAAVLLVASRVARAGDEPAKLNSAQFREIRVTPTQMTLSGARSVHGLRVTGIDQDGGLHDVTADCQFTGVNADMASVSADGLITPLRNGQTEVSVTYGSHTAKATIETRNLESTAYNFRNDVLPVLENLGCNQMGCHGSPKGKERLQLSLFSADPHQDFVQITDAKKELISVQKPEESWLLLKATCTEDHGGGDLTAEGDPAYNLLLDWIRNGAAEGQSGDASLERIEVFPHERTMIPGETQRLLVQAWFSDGSVRDITELASYRSSETTVASIDKRGLLTVGAYGETSVLVRFGGLVSSCLITAAQPADVPFPEIALHSKIDELVYAKLKSLNIIPSDVSSDEQFLRRVYLDVIGVLPTADEAREFLSDARPDKRSRLIDSLLDRPEFADFYAIRWGDILQINRDEPARLQDKGMWVYYRWLWDSLDQNKPMDQFVRELLTARGSAYESGPANFFRVGEGPQGMAEHASTAFLGVRLDCAHCHNHPFEQFTLDDNLGMAAFFSQVRSKRTREQDEEIIYTLDSGSVSHPDTKQRSSPMFLGGAQIAAVEKQAVETAAAEKNRADGAVAAATKSVESATKQLTAYQKSSAEKIKQAKQLASSSEQQAIAARKMAESAEKALAEAQSVADECERHCKQARSDLAEAEKAVVAAEALIAVSDAESSKAAVKAQEEAAERMASATAAMEAATAELAAAERVVKERLPTARTASRDSAIARQQMEQQKSELDTLSQRSQKKSAELNIVLTAASQSLAEAKKTVSRCDAAHRSAVAALTVRETTGDLRSELVDWIVAPDNPYFARSMSNRVWAWLLGRGIVNEPDDFRSTNPASNPELLDHLAASFVQSGFDMKSLFRSILNSRTYQLSSEPNEWNDADSIHNSYYHLKRLTAEQLAEAVCQVTGIPEKYSGLPLGTRATQLPDVSMRSEFLDLFGRPKRATPVESERTCDTHIGQSLQMISSDFISRKLRDSKGLAGQLAASDLSPQQAVEELYLTTLSRFPTKEECDLIFASPIEPSQRREKFEDLLWVLMNTKEFLFNH
ncbi:MAG: DUF1553 domain-containing protein [Planctomycetaceae bacterium]